MTFPEQPFISRDHSKLINAMNILICIAHSSDKVLTLPFKMYAQFNEKSNY